MRPMRSPRIAAIGASSTGGRVDRDAGIGEAEAVDPATSGNSRITWRNASKMPISSTPMIRALRAGLARNATQICWWMTMTISAHRIRNTDIRTRKILGEETLKGSSCAMSGLSSAETHASIWHR